eukprot:gene9332-12574_t
MVDVVTYNDWEIPLCSIGDCVPCLYAWGCTSLAFAEGKSNVDGSQVQFNATCIPCCVTRWLVRTAYGIPGDACNDCLLSTFCSCCVANQLFQTSYRLGNPVKNSGGYHNNIGEKQTTTPCTCSACCYSLWCFPCATGKALERSIGMPFFLGCCCVNPCTASQLVRYQYRIKGSDIGADLVFPYVLYSIGYALNLFTAGAALPLIFIPYTVNKVAGTLAEAESRGGGEAQRYLAGYNPYTQVIPSAPISGTATTSGTQYITVQPMEVVAYSK